MPESQIATQPDFASAFTIRALTLNPEPASGGAFSAALFSCPTCRTKIQGWDSELTPTPGYTFKDAHVGGYIWLSYRGDTNTCGPTDAHCNVDYDRYMNKVFVHHQRPNSAGSTLTTEKWCVWNRLLV